MSPGRRMSGGLGFNFLLLCVHAKSPAASVAERCPNRISAPVGETPVTSAWMYPLTSGSASQSGSSYLSSVCPCAMPSVAALVGRKSIEQCLPRGFLHIHIERRINAQPAFVHLIAAVFRFQVTPHFLYIMRCQ